MKNKRIPVSLILTVLLLLNALQLFTGCMKFPKSPVVDDPTLIPDDEVNVTFTFEARLIDNTVRTEKVTTANKNLGEALEALGYIQTDNCKITHVFGQNYDSFMTDTASVYWEFYINGVQTDKTPFDIEPVDGTVYSMRVFAAIN